MVRTLQAEVQQLVRRRRLWPATSSNAVITPGAGTNGSAGGIVEKSSLKPLYQPSSELLLKKLFEMPTW